MNYTISFQERAKFRFGTAIQGINHYLGNGKKTGADLENEKYFKRKEAERLEKYIVENNLWVKNIDFSLKMVYYIL